MQSCGAAAEAKRLDDTSHEATLHIQAVLFDADGVIQRPSALRREAWQSLLGPGRSVDDFFSAVLRAERPAWIGAADFIDSFSGLLLEWRCVGTLDDALAAWTMIEPELDMLSAIAALRRRGVGCHLATNQEPIRAAYCRSGSATADSSTGSSTHVDSARPSPTRHTFKPS